MQLYGLPRIPSLSPVSVTRGKPGNTWATKEAGVCGLAPWELQGGVSQGAELQGSRRKECLGKS